MNKKATYQNLAVVDVRPHVLVEIDGISKAFPLPISYLQSALYDSRFSQALQSETQEQFNITEDIEFTDITPELQMPTGPHESIMFGHRWDDNE